MSRTVVTAVILAFGGAASTLAQYYSPAVIPAACSFVVSIFLLGSAICNRPPRRIRWLDEK